MFYRIIRLVISSIFFIFFKIFTYFTYIINFTKPRVFVILTYHLIETNQRKKFARQMEILIKNTIPVNAETVNLSNKGQYFAAVTFDDGFQCLIENALPELYRRKIPATIFIPTGYIGKYPQWLTTNHSKKNNIKVMTIKEIKEISGDLVTIGSHSVNHLDLTLLNEKSVLSELVKSKKFLEKTFKRNINLFAFPFGNYNKKLLILANNAGYRRVFSNIPSFLYSKIEKFHMGRIDVSPNDWSIEFYLKLLGAYQWLPLVTRIKKYINSR